MNSQKLKAAVKKFSEFKNTDELETKLQADEKNYTVGEIAEIMEAINGVDDDADSDKGGDTGKGDTSKPKDKKVKKGDKPGYEEWDVQITNTKEGPKYEKLKIKRKRVLISEEQAEILNEGVLHGNNNYAVMYFLPE